MNPKRRYIKLAIAGGVILTFGLTFFIILVGPDPRKSGAFGLGFDIIALLTCTFWVLGEKRMIFLIGLIIWVLGINLTLLDDSFLPLFCKRDTTIVLGKTGTIFMWIGLIILLLGNWLKMKNKYLAKELKLGLITTLLFVFASTILIQLLVRII